MKNLNIEKIQNYKNITKSLLEKTSTIAKFIEDICDENGINSILNNKYILRSYSSTSCQYVDLCLVVEDQYNHVEACLSCKYISAGRESHYRNGDYNARYNEPCREDIKEFINDLPAIFEDIEKQVNACDNDALNQILNLIRG